MRASRSSNDRQRTIFFHHTSKQIALRVPLWFSPRRMPAKLTLGLAHYQDNAIALSDRPSLGSCHLPSMRPPPK